MEARGLAAHRWSRLFDLEAQVQRDEQKLVARPKKRPAQHGDDMLANEIIKRLETAFGGDRRYALRIRGVEGADQARMQRARVTEEEVNAKWVIVQVERTRQVRSQRQAAVS